VDGAGSAYVAGATGSADFPTTPGAFQTTYGGGYDDAFVAKFDFSGPGPSPVPTTPGTFLPHLAGFFGGFLAELDATGSGLVDSTYLDGKAGDHAPGGAGDGAGSTPVVFNFAPGSGVPRREATTAFGNAAGTTLAGGRGHHLFWGSWSLDTSEGDLLTEPLVSG
jgi:hypothetical protein